MGSCIDKYFGIEAKLNDKSKGMIHAGNERYRQNIGTLPVRLCGKEWQIDEYRGKCFVLIFGTSIKGFISLVHRLWDFMRLGSLRRAHIYSQREIKILKFHDQKTKKIHVIGLRTLGIYCKNITACVLKDVTKIATFPIYLALLQTIAILGVILPRPGRILFAKTQRVWEYDNLLEREEYRAGKRVHSRFISQWSNFEVHYVAPCFQSLEDANRLNLHLNIDGNNHRGLRSRWLSLQYDLKTYRKCFSPEDYKELNHSLKKIKQVIYQISPRSYRELDDNDEIKPHFALVSDEIQEIRAQLNQYIEGEGSLETVKKRMESMETFYLPIFLQKLREKHQKPQNVNYSLYSWLFLNGHQLKNPMEQIKFLKRATDAMDDPSRTLSSKQELLTFNDQLKEKYGKSIKEEYLKQLPPYIIDKKIRQNLNEAQEALKQGKESFPPGRLLGLNVYLKKYLKENVGEVEAKE